MAASSSSAGSPPNPLFPDDADASGAIDVARQAQHIADPALPLIGFSNDLPGYANACYRNELISLLINLPPLSGWIVSDTQGQLDHSPTAHLLENVIREYFGTNLAVKQARSDRAIQRLMKYFNIPKIAPPNQAEQSDKKLPLEVDLTKLGPRYPANTQQDAGEVLLCLLNDMQAELRL